jgi:outer membrane protein OmpA-like peptidoglycan-associated protein
VIAHARFRASLALQRGNSQAWFDSPAELSRRTPVSLASQPTASGVPNLRRIRIVTAVGVACPLLLLAACGTTSFSPPPAVAPPVVAGPLGLGAAYLVSDVLGGRRTRATRLSSAGVRPLTPAGVPAYLAKMESDLRGQTAGIGVDVIRVGDGILVRIPASLTFNYNSAEIRPQFEATLNEVARNLKANRQTYVDVLAHTDTSGTPQYNQTLSERRAAAVAAYLTRQGVAKARISSRGYGETAPLYNPDNTEERQAANRRVELRIAPFRQTDIAPTGGRRRRT